MMRLLAVAICCLSTALYAADFYGITDPNMGEYEGFWKAKNGTKGRLTAQVRPLANNQYDGFILFTRPKSGPVTALSLSAATAEREGIKFTGATPAKNAQGDILGKSEAQCELKNGKITGTFKGDLGEGTFEASKSERKSKLMGARPPKHAVVLFDGKNTDGWKDFNWKVTNDGAMEVTKGDIHAKEKLGSFRLHVEFRTPYMPTALGQARGNSGVYLQNKYEVQVLDSFGIYPLQDNDCGGIYHVQAPQVNACFPPMTWQTYDITYLNGDAAKGEVPNITVMQNGLLVIDHVKVPAAMLKSGTTGADENSDGFLKLQDHGNPVQYRNIWAEPLFSKEKKR